MHYGIPEPKPPSAVAPSMFNNFDIEIDKLLHAPQARNAFQVDGSGLAAAVLDTGLRITHRCFAGRVRAWRNFTAASGGDPDDVTDTNGHGTNVAGIIAAGTNDERRGIAPGAGVVALKVLPAPTFDPIMNALLWVREDAAQHGMATAFSTRADQLTPFTQRLSKEASPDCYTDVMSAGASATSAGAADDDATSIQDGTSQAAPTVAGVILLMQQHYKRLTGELPPIALLQDVLRSTSTWLMDGDNEDDNVKHSQRRFPRINAFESLVALDRQVKLAAAA